MSNSTHQPSDGDAPPTVDDESRTKQLLFNAAAADDLHTLKSFVRKKLIPLTSRDRDNDTAAHIAAKKGKYLALRFLLQHCPALLTETDAAGKTVLHRAVTTDQPKLIKYLLDERTADMHLRCSSPAGNTVVHEAAALGAIRVLQYLQKDKNADLNVRNRRGEPPIFLAAANNHFRVVRYLVDGGNVDPTLTDDDGNNILFALACTGSVRVIIYLVNKGIYYDVNWRNKRGECALHRAVTCDRLDLVRHLVDVRHVDFEIADNEGRTPLYEAARIGYVDIVRYLVSKGAKVHYWAADGTRPVDVAKDEEVIAYLRAQPQDVVEQRVHRRAAPWSADLLAAEVRSHKIERYPALSSADREPSSSIGSSQVNGVLTLANACIRFMFRR